MAKKRLAFEEIFIIQLIKGIEREKYQTSGAFIINCEKKKRRVFTIFGFDLTKGQKKLLKIF